MFQKKTLLVFVFEFALLKNIVDMFIYTTMSISFPTQLISDICLLLDGKDHPPLFFKTVITLTNFQFVGYLNCRKD